MLGFWAAEDKNCPDPMTEEREMPHGFRTVLAAIALALLPAAAKAACTETAYSESVLDCESHGKAGSADFAASCSYVQAPPVEAETEHVRSKAARVG